jgi:sugar/nucleoside kinase (ribokinase family)
MKMSDEVWQSEWNPGGPHYVVITDGRHGGRVSYEGKTFWYEPKWVEAVEETGAGDGFGSGMVAALMMGKPIEEAVEWGKKQAASVVSFMGAKKGLLTIDAIAS